MNKRQKEMLQDLIDNKKNQINKLQQENQQLKRYCNIGNENLNFFKEEYNKLEHNWKKLKEYCEEIISTDNELYGTDLLDKMAYKVVE